MRLVGSATSGKLQQAAVFQFCGAYFDHAASTLATLVMVIRLLSMVIACGYRLCYLEDSGLA